jgi:3-phenylpropionate/trans-cinnamate dioxygenase ferredoxin component
LTKDTTREPGENMSAWIEVVAVAGFESGTYVNVDVEGVNIAVFNLNGEFFALEDVCPHDYNCLTGGKIEGEEIVCPRHGARFSIKTGAVLAPPAYENVPTFPLRVVDGVVQVRDDRWD